MSEGNFLWIVMGDRDPCPPVKYATAAAVRALPDKQSASDPIPTSLLKSCIDVLSPFLVELFNRSLLTGSVPTIFKAAYITPLQEARLGPCGCTFIPTNFQPVGAVQAA